MELDELFEKASKHVRHVENLKEDDMLKLYGLYKQAKEGPCNISKPRMWEFTAKAKWESWNSLCTLSQEEAKEGYIELVQLLDPEWDENSTENESSGLGVSVSVLMKDPEDDIKECDKTVFDWCREGHLKKLESVLNKDKSLVNLIDDNKLTLLHWAVDQGFLAIANYLIHIGCNINCQDSELQTPLHYAVTCGHFDLAEFLLKTGADQQIKDVDGNVPSFYCDDDNMRNLFS